MAPYQGINNWTLRERVSGSRRSPWTTNRVMNSRPSGPGYKQAKALILRRKEREEEAGGIRL